MSLQINIGLLKYAKSGFVEIFSELKSKLFRRFHPLSPRRLFGAPDGNLTVRPDPKLHFQVTLILRLQRLNPLSHAPHRGSAKLAFCKKWFRKDHGQRVYTLLCLCNFGCWNYHFVAFLWAKTYSNNILGPLKELVLLLY